MALVVKYCDDAYVCTLCTLGKNKLLTGAVIEHNYAHHMHNYEFQKQPSLNSSGASSTAPVAPVAIVGARGYAGLELSRILLKHPAVRLTKCFAGESAFSLGDSLPEASAQSVQVLPTSEITKHLSGIQFVFLATPAEASVELASKILNASSDVCVIDLSGAFRLNAEQTKKWYGICENPYLAQAQYGLVPWCGPVTKGTRLISNPGCYATAALMAIIPLIKAGVIDPRTLVIDAKSGATGAGRKASENLLFCEVEGECLPYRVGKHQHLPEIIRYVQAFAGAEIDPVFATHLLPVRRGILASIYARTTKILSNDDVAAIYNEAYSRYPLVRHGLATDQNRALLSLKRVAGSARTELRYLVEGDKLHVFSLIDNLLKGAASQAVENLNRVLDLPVTTGLTDFEGTL
jgi:N-acetyl-gamma-glutamyl-phosphate reductase